MSVTVKWADKLSSKIHVNKGTRQGGLSSPFLFNLFYQELVDTLSHCAGGLRIKDTTYNVFCYADDLLLCSLTPTGLQNLIDTANRYITEYGLSFNPAKTECMIFGPCTLESRPKWELNSINLKETDSIKYLGVTLSYRKPYLHIQERISACRRAFYSLQGAGLGNTVTDARAVSYIWNTAIRPVLLYGLNCTHINRGYMSQLEKTQARLFKAALGLHKYCKSSPVLNAMDIVNIQTSVDTGCIELAKSIFCNESRARTFYLYLMKSNVCDKFSLLSRVKNICSKHSVHFMKYMADESYAGDKKRHMKRTVLKDGLADSVQQLLLGPRDQYNNYVLNLLLTPF